MDELSTAFHEAGHAVVALRLGRRFRYVTVTGDDHSFGHLQPWKWSHKFNPELNVTPRAREIVDAEVSVLYAGGIAEKRETGQYDEDGASGDRRQAIDLASYLVPHPKELEAYLNWRWVAAELLVESLWQEIGAVALQLRLRKKLTMSEARRFAFPPLGERS